MPGRKGGIVARASGIPIASEAFDWAVGQCPISYCSIEPFANGRAAIAEIFDGEHDFGVSEPLDRAHVLATDGCAVSDRRLRRTRVTAWSK